MTALAESESTDRLLQTSSSPISEEKSSRFLSYQNDVISNMEAVEVRSRSSNCFQYLHNSGSSSSSPPPPSCRWIVRLVGVLTMATVIAMIKAPIAPNHAVSVSSADNTNNKEDLHKQFYPNYADVVDALHKLNSQIEGSIYMFDQRGFESAALVWNNLANQRLPFAVIQVQHEPDVQMVLPVLRQLNEQYAIPFRIRSGGHHKAGYSSVEDGIVVSLVRMNSIQIQASSDASTAIATLEPAVLVQDMLTKVLMPFGYAGVIGICGSVAESGFLLGGGLGFQSRLRGLGLDHVVGMRIVQADGRVRDVDENRNSDLFWALRGAGGGNFGVVTQLRVQLYQAQDTQLLTQVTVSYQDLPIVFHRMGELNANNFFPGELCVLVGERSPAKNKLIVKFMWFALDPTSNDNLGIIDSKLQNVLLDLFNETAVDKNWTIAPVSWTGTVQFNRVQKTPNPWAEPPWIKPFVQAWTGYLYQENNTLAIWTDIICHISTILKECSYLAPHVELWGGVISQVKWNATAFPHRKAIDNVGVLLYVPSFKNPKALKFFKEQSSLVNAWWPNVSQYLNGVYNNYPMASLSRRDYPRAYWGDNLERLVSIKQKYDPTNAFQFEQSVPIQL